MDLVILSALMFCWAGGMIMGAAIMYGIIKQQDPKPDLTDRRVDNDYQPK